MIELDVRRGLNEYGNVREVSVGIVKLKIGTKSSFPELMQVVVESWLKYCGREINRRNLDSKILYL